MTIGQRLREERERVGMTQTALAGVAGVTKNTQLLYESDQRSPKADYLEHLSGIGIDIQFVVTGNRSDSVGVERSNHEGCAISLYNVEAAAGAGSSLEREEIEATLYLPLAELSARRLDPANMVGVRVSGDSMEPTLADGDWVLVDRSDCPERPEGVYLLLIHGERRIKRVQRVAGGGWFLISDNDLYQAELIKPQDKPNVQILGRCVMKIGEIS